MKKLPTTVKSRLLILDADVVIFLHRLGRWEKVTSVFDVYLSETVVSECKFYFDVKTGTKVYIDWEKQIDNDLVKRVGLDAPAVLPLMKKLQKLGGPEIHDGELETLALGLQLSAEEPIQLCLADHGAIKAAVLIALGECCISLESVLKECGLTARIDKQFSDAWLADIRKQAEILRVQNLTL